MELILGSQSPRRKDVLSFFNLPFRQVSPSFDEDAVPFEGNPIEYVNTLSKGKALSLQDRFLNQAILTADTVVYKEGKIFNKPKDKQEAHQHLRELAGRWHSVFTGLTLSYAHQAWQQVEETRVQFNPLTEQQIYLYQHALCCTDQAGGYMIQGAGSLVVKRIEGCYYNVLGLPVNALHELLLKIGIDMWEHLIKPFRSRLS